MPRSVPFMMRIRKLVFRRDGERRVRIHAIGFPVYYMGQRAQPESSIRFAALMRELTWRNGGTFVGLNGL